MIKDYDVVIENLNETTKNRFKELYEIVLEVTSGNVEERLWAKLPSLYYGESFVRIIPFKDHINLEAKAISSHKNELIGYKITPKGMLQIFNNQSIPVEVVKVIIHQSLLA